MKSCIYCGNVIEDKDLRCPYCGREQFAPKSQPQRQQSTPQNQYGAAADSSQNTIMFNPKDVDRSQENRPRYDDDNNIYSHAPQRNPLGDEGFNSRYEQREPTPPKKEINKPFVVGMSIAGIIILVLIILLVSSNGSGRQSGDEQTTQPTSPSATEVVATTQPTSEITTSTETTEPTTESTEPTADEPTEATDEPTTEAPIIIGTPLSGNWVTNVMISNGQTVEEICTFRSDGSMNVTIADARISLEGTYSLDGDSLSTSISLLGGRNAGNYTYQLDGKTLITTDSQGNQIKFVKM